MRKVRITVTVNPAWVARAEEAVAAGEAPSVSAWVDEAMAEKSGGEDIRVILAEMEADHPVSEEVRQWARDVLRA